MMKRLESPRTWSILLAICSMLWILDDISCQVSAQPFTIVGIPILALALAINYIFHLIPRKRAPEDQKRKPWRDMWRWLAFPSATLITISALYDPWPMTLRFSLSQKEFENKLKEIQNAVKVDMGPQIIGLYRVREIATETEAKVLFMTGESISDPVGICYDPTQPPSIPLHRKIVDSWYASE